ncbi:MAG: transaldolase [Acidobacteriota bacterium]|nr:transaldolase [Acidobacteriota bacterium]MDE3043826.1 transaldolase [Acidobacteriota bacterium]
MTKLNDLYDEFGQSPWIDNIRRDWLNDGTLADLVRQGVRGVTSNPSIFAKAFATSSAYDELVAASTQRDPEALFEELAVADVRDACDVTKSVFEESRRDFAARRRRYLDGFVSLEVSPRLAHDTAGTIAAASRLNNLVGRPNVMIKIPATLEGLPAITEALSRGINVNVTLIFSLERYEQVLNAWLAGLEAAAREGHDLGAIASVASFFVSRVDAAVDALLEDGDPRRGRSANAQVAAAYELYRATIAGARAQELLTQGAQVQRPLWASTSTKNPAYDELLYVDTIVADETVNTMPDATLQAALHRGAFGKSALRDASTARALADELALLTPQVSLAQVTTQLEIDGVRAFVDAYEELLTTVASKMRTS